MNNKLHQLADQLEAAAKETREQASEQDREGILARVLAPGGIFHGKNWHENFRWHLNPPGFGPSDGNLVANGFDQDVFQDQWNTLYTSPQGKVKIREHFGCNFNVNMTSLTLNNSQEYLPFIREHHIKLDTLRKSEYLAGVQRYTAQADKCNAVLELIREQEGTPNIYAQNYDTPAPATSGVVGSLLTRKDLEVIRNLVQKRMAAIRDESPDNETYLNKIGNITAEGEGVLGIAKHLDDLLTSPLATDRFWLTVDKDHTRA